MVSVVSSRHDVSGWVAAAQPCARGIGGSMHSNADIEVERAAKTLNQFFCTGPGRRQDVVAGQESAFH